MGIEFWPRRVTGYAALILLAICAVLSFTHTGHSQQTDRQQPSWLNEAIKSGADAEVLEKFSPQLSELQEKLARHRLDEKSGFISSEELQGAIEALEALRPELRKFVDDLTPERAEARAKLEKLGPAPKEGEPESDDVARQRNAIVNEAAAYDGLIKRAEVMFVEAGQTISALNTRRRAQFLSGLLRRSSGIADENFLENLSNSIAIRWGLATALVKERLIKFTDAWPSALLAVFLAFFTFLVVRFLTRRTTELSETTAYSEVGTLPRAERGAIVLRRSLSFTMPGAAALLALLISAFSLELVTEDEFNWILRFIAYATVSLFLVSAIHFALKPPREIERLIAIDTRSANALQFLAAIYVAVWFIDQSLELFDQFIQSPFLLVVARTSLVSILYSVILFGFIAVRIRRHKPPPSSRRTNGWPNILFGLIAITAAGILAATLLGYVSLARFLGSQLVATGGLALFVTLMHLTAEYVSTPSMKPAEDGGAQNQTMLGATLGVVFGIALDILILLIGLPLLLLQWGFDWPEVRGWISSALFGFQIGQVQISLLQIFLAFGVFVAGLLLTGLVRRMFLRRTENMFAPSTGTRDSIGTILGYVGITLAAVAALSYVGLNFANLALIAGALSVGIGFGLQSIVNNFVSGLILLAERPIKVGDWIIVGDRQGRVQKISVRSTQIRLFDRSTLVIPNADLITNQVVNWDLGDSVGRVSIGVGVSYQSDPRQVIELLMGIGRSHPGVLVYDRSPRVMFEAFGESSLDFVLHVHLRNIKDFLDVQTDLRVAIVEAFREASIEIPFPQRDLHVRSLDTEIQKEGLYAPAVASSGNADRRAS
jgi:potassium efflux system protein